MSQWTHVSGCIRIDGIPAMGVIPDWKHIFGEPSSDPEKFSTYFPGRNIPGGSEGTIQYKEHQAGTGLVWLTVAIWGDLRDFGMEATPQIDKWFARIVESQNDKNAKMLIRSAELLVEVEYGPRYFLVAKGKEVERFELPAAADLDIGDEIESRSATGAAG